MPQLSLQMTVRNAKALSVLGGKCRGVDGFLNTNGGCCWNTVSVTEQHRLCSLPKGYSEL